MNKALHYNAEGGSCRSQCHSPQVPMGLEEDLQCYQNQRVLRNQSPEGASRERLEQTQDSGGTDQIARGRTGKGLPIVAFQQRNMCEQNLGTNGSER